MAFFQLKNSDFSGILNIVEVGSPPHFYRIFQAGFFLRRGGVFALSDEFMFDPFDVPVCFYFLAFTFILNLMRRNSGSVHSQ